MKLHMKTIIRIIIGVMLVLCGALIVAVSIYYTLQGQFLWLVVLLAAAALATAGVRLVMGDRLRDILEDLLFVFIRTN